MIPVTWAGSFIAGKFVVQNIDPVDSVFFRFLLSALVMFPLVIIWQRKSHPPLLNKKFIFHLLIVVLTSGIGYHLLFFAALKHTTPTNTALIIALNPFFTAIAEKYINKIQRPTRFYFGFIMAFSSAIWVILSRGNMGVKLPGKREILCFGAALVWSAYTIFSKRTKDKDWDSLWISTYNYLFTALILIPFSLNLFSIQYLGNISEIAWYSLIYMAVFPTAIGYTLFYIGIQKKGPVWAAAFIYLVPSITANFDYLFFEVNFTLPMVAGTTIVVAGLFVGNLSESQIEKIKLMNWKK